MDGVVGEGSEIQLEELTWSMFGEATQALASAIVADGYKPDMILAVARGGLFVAGALGYALGVKLLHVVNVEFYTGIDQRLNMPVMLPPIPDPADFSGARILIADDVADTGATIKLTQEFCERHVSEVRSAVIYQKPRSVAKCDYVWRHTADWIHFPWDARVSPPRTP
ncbi:MAG TPA: phosphoribosyltransferase [Thermomicrobiales bacterium]|nr:phosphoribosyltransferase [Thermomicrobiales bacterium]